MIGRRRALDAERRVSADELELLVREEHSREEPGLAEDLEPVADPEHRPPCCGEGADGVHHGRDARDRTGAEVVAVGESTGEHDCSDAGGKLARPGARRERARHRPLPAPTQRRGRRSTRERRRRRRAACPSFVLESDLEALDERVGEQARSTCAAPASAPPRGRLRTSSRSTTRPIRADETSKPSLRSECRTASPCGSRMPSFGRTTTIAFTAPPPGWRRTRRTGVP